MAAHEVVVCGCCCPRSQPAFDVVELLNAMTDLGFPPPSLKQSQLRMHTQRPCRWQS